MYWCICHLLAIWFRDMWPAPSDQRLVTSENGRKSCIQQSRSTWILADPFASFIWLVFILASSFQLCPASLPSQTTSVRGWIGKNPKLHHRNSILRPAFPTAWAFIRSRSCNTWRLRATDMLCDLHFTSLLHICSRTRREHVNTAKCASAWSALGQAAWDCKCTPREALLIAFKGAPL